MAEQLVQQQQRPQSESVEQWLDSQHLQLDCGFPGRSLAEVLDGCWAVADSSNKAATEIGDVLGLAGVEWRTVSDDGSVTVRKCHSKHLPVFTAEWAQQIEGKTIGDWERWIDAPIECCKQWDETCLDAQVLATWCDGEGKQWSIHGDDVNSDVKLLRYRFSAGGLFSKRELLYISVKSVRGKQHMRAYLSVKETDLDKCQGDSCSSRHRYVRARNLAPTFDLAEPYITCDQTDQVCGIRLRHVITTHLGGKVPNCVWNSMFAPFVTKTYAVEGLKVRNLLLGGLPESSEANRQD